MSNVGDQSTVGKIALYSLLIAVSVMQLRIILLQTASFTELLSLGHIWKVDIRIMRSHCKYHGPVTVMDMISLVATVQSCI
jgi:hypothetical protein